MFEGNRDQLRVKNCFFRQSLTKYLAKSKEIRQNWRRAENFDVSFCVSFNHWCKKLISGGEAAQWLVFPRNSKILLSLSNSRRS